MNRDEILASVDLIKASLSSRESRTITGALLGELVRKITPELNLRKIYPTGQKVLSRFIKDYFADFLEPLNRQGGDILYSIIPDVNAGGGLESSAIGYPLSANYDIWVAFARPNSASSVFVDLQKSELFVGESKLSDASSHKIQSATPNELTIFRGQFIDALSPELYDASIYSTEGSYSSWLETIRSCGGKLFNRWSVFRIQKLHELFRSRLEALGVEGEQLQFLCDAMKKSQENPPKKAPARKDIGSPQSDRVSVVDRTSSQPPAGDIGFLNSEEAFRSVVIESVKRMSLSEMRTLNIPAGLFLDSVNSVLKK